MKKHLILSAAVIISLAAGLFIGWESWGNKGTPSVVRVVREDEANTSPLINKLLYVETTEAKDSFGPAFENKISDYINQSKEEGLADNISVYIRDLNNSRWLGVDEDEVYEPSSLLKVLTMMAYLNAAEDKPSILNQSLFYSGKEDPGQFFKPQNKLPAGYYSVADLIEQTIIQSDNEAEYALFNAHKDDFMNTYNTLELPQIVSTSTPIDFMSPKAYSVIFRTLYNATYLSQQRSSEALQLLTKTTFKEGIVAGVPAGTTVAHKFGEHTTLRTDGRLVSRELHDCGIVYYPGSPYFLCVMTKGSDFNKLKSVIQNISRITYEQLSQVKGV